MAIKIKPDWFLNTKAWKSVIRLTPRLKGYPKFPIDNYFKIRDIIRKNPDEIYCFVGCDNHSVATILQRLFYKFWWGHSGFVELGEDGEIYISHVRKRLIYTTLLSYLKEVDNFALLKLPLEEEEKTLVKKKIKKLKESRCLYKVRDNLYRLEQYKDDNFWETNDVFYFYCSEYQYFVCLNMMTDSWKNGRKRFTTDDLYNNAIVVFKG